MKIKSNRGEKMTAVNNETTEDETGTTRRSVLKHSAIGAAGVLGGSSLLAACGSDSSTTSTASSAGPPTNVSGTINALCWEGYTDPAWTKGFTKETGVKVKSTFIGSNDELVAKLRGAPNQYDLVSPSSDTTNILIDANQVRTINLNQVPNAKTTMEFFQTAPAVNVDGKLYGVPVAWGFIPLIFDADKVKPAPTSWEDLWNPKYKNQLSVWQDIALIYTTAIQLGYKNVYTLDDTQLEAIKTKLIAQKPNIRKYWTTAGELANLFMNNEVIAGMSFGGVTITQLQGEGRNVKEIIPTEGATSWFDNWMIPAKSPNPDAALSYINYFHKPETQKQFAAITGYGITNENAFKLVTPEYSKVYELDNPDFITSLDYWKAVPRRQKYLDVLNAVIAA